jgi:nitrate reductase gamma subunit
MNMVLFAAWPYVALTLAVVGGLYRYYTDRFSYSSLSSQLLENRRLFWGSVPWHYGIIPILLAHLFAGLLPGATALILGGPGRLLVFELIGMSLGLFCLVGVVLLFLRRVSADARPRAVTSVMDWFLLVCLTAQVAAGVAIALFVRWGSLWYLHTAVPWFWSLVRLSPDFGSVAPLPALVQFHIVNGFLLIALFPFTRLVHIFTVPVSYLWRPYQVVIWMRERAAERGGL